MAGPAIAADLCHTMPIQPWALEAARLTGADALRPLLRASAQPNSDFYPILDLLAERARYLRSEAKGFVALSADWVDFTAPRDERRGESRAEAAPPMPGIPRVRALALAAALRDSSAVPDSANQPPGYEAARYRVAHWRDVLTSDRPPTDWRQWLADFRMVDGYLNGGLAGAVDETFYGPAFAYLERFNAPAEVWSVVRLRHGLASWEFKAAASAAERLLAAAAHERGWIAPEELLQGGLAAKLVSGDVSGAARFEKALADFQPPQWDLRSRLLAAYLEAAAAPEGVHAARASR